MYYWCLVFITLFVSASPECGGSQAETVKRKRCQATSVHVSDKFHSILFCFVSVIFEMPCARCLGRDSWLSASTAAG